MGWLSADGQTLLASMENLMLYSEGKGTKISSFFIRYAFGVLYKTIVIVTDGQLLETGKARQTSALSFWFLSSADTDHHILNHLFAVSAFW